MSRRASLAYYAVGVVCSCIAIAAAWFWVGKDGIEIVHLTPRLEGISGFLAFALGSILLGGSTALLCASLLPRLLPMLHWNRLWHWVTVGAILAELWIWALFGLALSSSLGHLLSPFPPSLGWSVVINTFLWTFMGIPYGVVTVIVLHRIRWVFPSRPQLSRGVALGVICLVFFSLFGVGIWGARKLRPNYEAATMVANEVAAYGSLRMIYALAGDYAATYNNGYPRDLRVLECPPAQGKASCNHACLIDSLIDSVVATGKKSGYVFTYEPGNLLKKPSPGCVPGVNSYRVTVRPFQYGKTGTRSFFMDESGVIRFTGDNRAATANDPPLR